MSIHCVYISSATRDGNAIDQELRKGFHDVYRVGTDFWLVDTGHAADHVVDIGPGPGRQGRRCLPASPSRRPG